VSPPDRAKLYFSLAVTPLPGVSIDGMTRDPTDFDGTEAVYYLRQVWSSLTPDQQKVAHDVMVGAGGQITRGPQKSAQCSHSRVCCWPVLARRRMCPRTTTRRSKSRRATKSQRRSVYRPSA
jgi:hypothetical protein